MRNTRWEKFSVVLAIAAGVSLLAPNLRAQEVANNATPAASAPASTADVRALSESVRELQEEVHSLSSEVSELRDELAAAKAKMAPSSKNEAGKDAATDAASVSPAPATPNSLSELASADAQPASADAQAGTPSATIEGRVATLEEDQQLTDAKLVQQDQTKVESASKYRVRFSGIVLLNLFENRGVVDNADFPGVAEEREPPYDSVGTFGASIRQSQIGVEAFGPDIAGAHTSASVKMDFAGGFPDLPNGNTMGVVRLRTGTIRLDWQNTSIVAGQDYLFFAPLAPTSYASLAVPALSYAGNLWAWAPQVRIEHRFHLADMSTVQVQGGVLDSLSGDPPVVPATYIPSWGEESGEPAYAARVSWTHPAFGEDLTIGAGGFLGRQFWGFDRRVTSWAGTLDATVPLGHLFSLSGEFYRGRAVGGLGGAVGQDVLMSGVFTDPTTVIRGLDSMGGWVQFKYKPTAKFQINAAVGDDNPFTYELDRFPSSTNYYGEMITRSLSPFANFIYQPRSDMLFSFEYRYLQTYYFQDEPYAAHHINISLGYLF